MVSSMKNILSAFLLCAVSGLTFAQSDFTRLNVNNFGVFSELGEPLDLIAPILGSEDLEDSEVMVSIAPEKYHQHAGLAVVDAHNSLALNTFKDRKGRTVLQMSTTSPILSEGIAFIAQIDWPEGRIYRQFTIDFDGQNGIVSATTDVGEKATALAINTTPIETPEPVAIMEPIIDTTQPIYDGKSYTYDNITMNATVSEYDASEFIQPYIDDSGLCSSHKVAKGDKLWEIVSGCLLGSQTIYQKMVATFNANKRAFNKRNMNSLRIGTTLLMPDDIAIDAISKRGAWNLYRIQLAKFQETESKTEVKVKAKAATVKKPVKKPVKAPVKIYVPKPVVKADKKPTAEIKTEQRGSIVEYNAAEKAVTNLEQTADKVKEAAAQAIQKAEVEAKAASSFRLVVATSTTTQE